MSLILDALKRAERERKAQNNSALADLVQPSSAPIRRRWPSSWRAVGAVSLALIIGLLLWTTLRETPTAPNENIATAPIVEPAPTTSTPTPGVIRGTENVVSLDDLADDPADAANQDAPPASAAPAAPTAPASQGPESSAPDTAAPESSVSAAESLPTAPEITTTPVPESVTAIPPALNQSATLRKLREMPPDYRADFPALNVEVHVYERDVAKRLLMINGRRYREGERLTEGPMVVEIVRDGIVLEHRGEQVLYTLGR